jgi:hypothetical protein
MSIIIISLCAQRLEDEGSIPGRDRDFSLCQHIQMAWGLPASYPMATTVSFPWED